MPLQQTKSSCFIDACGVAFRADAQELAAQYKELCPSQKPDVDGYHPSIVNALLLDKFRIGLSEIDCIPVDTKGNEYAESSKVTALITGWLALPGFSAVFTGVNEAGESHAVAFTKGSFYDTARGEVVRSDEPKIRIRSAWVLGLPPKEITTATSFQIPNAETDLDPA